MLNTDWSVWQEMKKTKEIILNEAFRLFASQSYRDVTLRQIIDSTGISKGALYYYYDNKEQLYREILEVYFLNLLNESLEILETSNDEDLFSSLFTYFNTTFNEMMNLGNFFGFYMLIFEGMKAFPDVRERIMKFYNDFRIKLGKKIIVYQKKGKMIEGNPQAISWMILSAIEGYLLLSVINPEYLTLRAFADHQKLLLNMLQPKYSEPKNLGKKARG